MGGAVVALEVVPEPHRQLGGEHAEDLLHGRHARHGRECLGCTEGHGAVSLHHSIRVTASTDLKEPRARLFAVALLQGRK